MRALILFLALLATGCKTAEVSVDYPIMGLHVCAKFEGREQAPTSEYQTYLARLAETEEADKDKPRQE
jgi:hypothetical protein